MRCTNIIYSSRMTRMKRPSLKSLSVMIFPDVGLLNPSLEVISLELHRTLQFVLPKLLVTLNYGMFIWLPGLKSISCRLDAKDLPIYLTFKTKFKSTKTFLGAKIRFSLQNFVKKPISMPFTRATTCISKKTENQYLLLTRYSLIVFSISYMYRAALCSLGILSWYLGDGKMNMTY